MRTISATHVRPTTRHEICRAAVCGALYFGVCCSVVSALQGAPPLRAVVAGLASFLVSMVTWTVYHIASRRNDGLIITAAGIMPAMAFFSAPGSLGVAMFCLALLTLGFLAPCAWFMGRCVLASAAAKAVKWRPVPPLNDADLDDGPETS